MSAKIMKYVFEAGIMMRFQTLIITYIPTGKMTVFCAINVYIF